MSSKRRQPTRLTRSKATSTQKALRFPRYEQALQHAEERRTNLDEELGRARKTLEELHQVVRSDRQSIEEIDEKIQSLTPIDAQHNERVDDASRALQQAEQGGRRMAARLGRIQPRARGYRAARARRTSALGTPARAGRWSANSNCRLEFRGVCIDTVALERTIGECRSALLAAEHRHDTLLKDRERVKTALHAARNDVARNSEILHRLHGEAASLKGKEASLVALQDDALRRDERGIQDWLTEHGLGDGALLAGTTRYQRRMGSGRRNRVTDPIGGRVPAVRKHHRRRGSSHRSTA